MKLLLLHHYNCPQGGSVVFLLIYFTPKQNCTEIPREHGEERETVVHTEGTNVLIIIKGYM